MATDKMVVGRRTSLTVELMLSKNVQGEVVAWGLELALEF